MDASAETKTLDPNYGPSSVSLTSFPKMPEDYRKTVIRLMSIQAYAEKIAAVGVPDWARKVPDYKAARTVAKIVADEARHAFLLYTELEALGVSEKEADGIAQSTDTGSSSLDGPASLDAPENGWEDMIMNHMFLDRAGKFMVGNFTQASYAPWAVACEKILKDEDMHVGFGWTEFRTYVRSGVKSREELTNVVSRWFVAGLNFFGPPPGKTQQKLAMWGIKRKDNDVLRREFREEVLGELETIGCADLIRIEHDQYPYR